MTEVTAQTSNPFSQAKSLPAEVSIDLLGTPAVVPPVPDPPADAPVSISPVPNQEPAKPAVVTPFELLGEDTYKEKDWNYVKEDLKTKNQLLTEKEKQIAELASRKPEFASPEVESWNAWLTNGGDPDYSIFSRVRQVEADKLDDIDAIIAHRIIQNPEFKGMEVQLKQELIDEYKLESTDERPLTPEQVQFNKAKIAVRGKESKDFLSGLKAKMQISLPDPSIANAAIEKRKEAWTPVINQVFDNFKSISIPVLKKDEAGNVVKDEAGNVVFEKLADFQVPENLQAQYKAIFTTASEKFPEISEKSAQNLLATAQKEFIFENLPHLISHAVQVREAAVREELDKKYNGAAVLKEPGAVNRNVNSSDQETMTAFKRTVNQ